MSEYLGRKVGISINSVVVANGRTKDLTIGNELIDITNDGSDGNQTFLNEIGQKGVEFSFSGLEVDEALLDLSLLKDPLVPIVFTFETFTLTGTFAMANYALGLPYNEAATVSASFSSSGEVVKAAI